ncbi:excisionase family DNA binding protein [Bradyrhizobium sp. LM2.7]
MEFLTTSEAADYLRLGERKLYELVTNGAIPCTKVTGKWLFPRHELDLWVLSGLARPAGMRTESRRRSWAAARTSFWTGACANPAPGWDR